MSTLKSADDHLTLNADGSSKNILFQADGVQKASISSAGLFTSTTIDATVLTGNLPALNGASLTSVTGTDATKLPLAGGTMTGPVVGDTLTDATNTGSITLDFSASQNFVLTLTGNVTLANPSTETVGQSGFIAFIQDGTGSRTVSLGTDYETAGAAGLTLTSTASATDLVPYLVVASNRVLLGTPQLAFA